MKPIIGITPEIAEDGKISLNYAYTHAIENAGGIPYVLPCTEDEALLDELVALCHGFCFSGGEDIEPTRYGEEKLPQCGARHCAGMPSISGCLTRLWPPESPFSASAGAVS